MKFGEIPVGKAVGAVLGHSVHHHGGVFKKGRVLGAGDLATLQESGVLRVYAGMLEAGDVGEDAAALRLARRLAGEHVTVKRPGTGRVNIHAECRGLAVIDEARVNAANAVDESITVATVAPFSLVGAGEMVATVKIIPFAVSGTNLESAERAAGTAPAIAVAPLVWRKVGLVITQVDGMRASLLKKAETAVRQRVQGLGSVVSNVWTVDHDALSVAGAVAAAEIDHDLVLVFGASAIVDRGDVVPAALTAAGGEVEHLGMPVDPGNLLMLGSLGGTPVIGVPSCARSPKLNGFDWVLARVLAGVTLTGRDLIKMGVGGLLKEIASRPSPREGGA